MSSGVEVSFVMSQPNGGPVTRGISNVVFNPVGLAPDELPDYTVWEFYVSAKPQVHYIGIYQIQSSFGVTPENLVLHNVSSEERNGKTHETSVTDIRTGDDTGDDVLFENADVGSKLWTITDSSRSRSTVFTINWRKNSHMAGVRILRNGVEVYIESEGGGGSSDHYYPVIYDMSFTDPPVPGVSAIPGVLTYDLTTVDSGNYATDQSSLSQDSDRFKAWHLFNRGNGTWDNGWASETAAPPHWITIKLSAAKEVTGFRLWNSHSWRALKINSFTIQGSNVGGGATDSAWTTLGDYQNVTYETITPSQKSSNSKYVEDFTNDDKLDENIYLFESSLTITSGMYRMYVTGQEGTYAGASELVLLVDYVPQTGASILPRGLTSYSERGYVVTTSSILNDTYEAFHVFNRRQGTSNRSAWISSTGVSPEWVAIQLPKAASVSGVRVWSTETFAGQEFTSFKIQGKQDSDPDWTDVGVFTDITWITILQAQKSSSTLFQNSFDVDTKITDYAMYYESALAGPVSYKNYRLYLTAPLNQDRFNCTELELLAS
jgi:hypothetical protein